MFFRAGWGLVGVIIITGCQLMILESSPGPDVASLILSMSLDKTRYMIGEEVLSTNILRNEGDRTVLVNKRLVCNSRAAPHEFRVISHRIIAPSGEELGFQAKINIGFPEPEDFVELRPGELVEGICSLSLFYELDTRGVYSVQAFYENQSDPEAGGIVAWKGQLASKPITFTVVTTE